MSCYPYAYRYSSTEITTLQNFVNSGHGIVFMSRYYYYELTQITSPFEISWTEFSSGQSGTYTNITPHEITTNVNSVYYNYHRSELVVQGGAKALIYDDDKISPKINLAISNESGVGRVVCSTDPYGFNDWYINNANNKLLASQVMDWVVGDSSAPKRPSSFKAVNGKLGNQVNLSWSANIERDLVGYYLYRSNVSGVYDDPPILVDGSKTSYKDKGPHLVDGIQYFYKLAAIDEVPNISPLTGERSATPTDVIPPAVPQNFTVNDLGTGLALNISWNKNKEADLVEYRIYKSDKINFNNQQQFNMTPDENYYVDTDVVEGTNYYYKLTAVDEVPNESDLPPVKDGTPYDRIAPVKPTGLAVTDPGIGNALELRWNHSTDVDLVDYLIERKDTKGNFKTIVVPAPADYYMDTNQLVDGRKYSYRLYSRDDSKLKPPNQSPGTTWVSGRPSDVTPPTIPFNFTVTDISYSTGLEYIQCLNLSWNLSTDKDLRGFILYKFDYPQFTLKDERILADLGFANYYLDYDVIQDGIYYYKLVAYDEVPNYSDPSIELTAIPKDVTPSPIPKQFKGEALPQGNAVRLSWALMPASETEGFRLYYKQNDTTEFQLLAELGKAENYFLHYALIDDRRYYYKLKSYDNVLPEPNYSPFTSIISVTPSDVLPPAKPSGLSVELVETGRALEIIWVPNSEEDLTGYRVYRSADNLPYTLIIGVDKNTTKVIDTGLVNKKTYRYYVTAIDEVPNESDHSAIKNEIPLDVISPSSPTNVSASIPSGKSSIVLTWTPVNESDIMSYLIYRSTDNSNYEKIAEVPFTQKSFEDNDVNPGERYYYRISTSDDGPNYSPRTKPVDINVPDKESGQFSTETQMMIAIGAVIMIIIILLLLLILVLKKKQRAESKKEEDKDKVEPSLPMAQPQSQVQAPVQVQAQTVTPTPTYAQAATPGLVTSTPIIQPTILPGLQAPGSGSGSGKITPVTPMLPPASTDTETVAATTTTETETRETKTKDEPDDVVDETWLETPDSTVEPEVLKPVSPAEAGVEPEPQPETSSEPVQDMLQPVVPIEPEPKLKPAPAFIKPISPSKPKPTILIPIDDEQSKIQGIRRRKDRITITNPELLDIPNLQLTTPPVGVVWDPEEEKKKQQEQEREQERARMREQKSKLRLKTKAPVKQVRKPSQKQPRQKSASDDDIKNILGKYMGKSEKPAEKPKPVMKNPMKKQTSKDEISNILGKYKGKNEPTKETPKKKKTSEDDIKDLLAQYKN